jgi:hypothetical protein
METKLLPCPFCGGDGKIDEDDTAYFIRCGRCEARGPRMLTARAAEMVWNEKVKS